MDNLLAPSAALYSRLSAATLAHAHARWGDRIAIASLRSREVMAARGGASCL